MKAITMTTLSNLRARKQKLLERLLDNPGPHERDEVEGLLARIETALDLLVPHASGDAGAEPQRGAGLHQQQRPSLGKEEAGAGSATRRLK
jgi:hypothetical protein